MNNQNYIILKRGYVIFSLLLIALLFLNSCNNIEEYSGGSVIEELWYKLWLWQRAFRNN